MRSHTATASLAALAAAFSAVPAAGQAPWSVAGELQDSDRSTGEGDHRYDEHAVRLEAGQRYRISVESEAFDPVAQLYRAGEDEPVAENDDSGASLNSRISYAPPSGGDFVLRVIGFSADARGAYTAEVAPMPPLPAPIASPGTAVTTSGTWSLWQGELGPADADLDGQHYDDYLIRVEAGQTRYISVDSSSFDPLVQLLLPAARDSVPVETLDGDDDAGAGLNALLAFAPEEAGDYIVRVTSYGQGTGAYRLWVSQ
ncbi:MAG TPA: hypothetical protein VN231_03240 [Allosphingosinicella sp.]|nr:hypothetical protein [Allosphingosinicella sp.]